MGIEFNISDRGVVVLKKAVPFERYFPSETDKKFWDDFKIKYPEKTLAEFLTQEPGLGTVKELDTGDVLVENTPGGELQVKEAVRKYHEKYPMHITRMFGSYILLAGEPLRAVHATPIPIKYCPLMRKLLNEVGGETAQRLLETLEGSSEDEQRQLMCRLINEVVIDGGYFDTKRPLNSCEANVLFGASEMLFSAFRSGHIDAAVIVSNNLGTIITTTAEATQGAVKRMTGLFYTSPARDIMETAEKENIIPVFPYTARIDQIAGLEEALERGYRRVAVSLASHDNRLWGEVENLAEKYGAEVYRLGLCSTGIAEETAAQMQKYSDIIWSCASKAVKEYIEPKAIAQVGLKIPVYIMTERGWKLASNHLGVMQGIQNFGEDTVLASGENRPVFLNGHDGIRKVMKKELLPCSDCPTPCI